MPDETSRASELRKDPTGGAIEPTTGAIGQPMLGADADGDGVADALLSRMVPGELNGVTWYVGYRIVDNAAKVNVNTAFSRDRDWPDSDLRFVAFP